MCTSNRRITNTHAAHVTYFMRLVVAVFALQAAPSRSSNYRIFCFPCQIAPIFSSSSWLAATRF